MSPIQRQIELNLYQLMKIPKLFLQQSARTKINQKVLLLGTIGRKTGKVRWTPLQYEYFKNHFYLGSMRGKQADWVKNIQNNQKIFLQLRLNNDSSEKQELLTIQKLSYHF